MLENYAAIPCIDHLRERKKSSCMVLIIAFFISDSNTFPTTEHNHLRCSSSSRWQ